MMQWYLGMEWILTTKTTPDWACFKVICSCLLHVGGFRTREVADNVAFSPTRPRHCVASPIAADSASTNHYVARTAIVPPRGQRQTGVSQAPQNLAFLYSLSNASTKWGAILLLQYFKWRMHYIFQVTTWNIASCGFPEDLACIKCTNKLSIHLATHYVCMYILVPNVHTCIHDYSTYMYIHVHTTYM